MPDVPIESKQQIGSLHCMTCQGDQHIDPNHEVGFSHSDVETASPLTKTESRSPTPQLRRSLILKKYLRAESSKVSREKLVDQRPGTQVM